MIRRHFSGLTAMTLLALAVTACGSAPRTTFYTLSAGSAREDAQAATASFRVSVGPVTVPDVVDRPQMVVRVGVNQVALLDQHRWAEPLRSEIPRVIAGDLASLLGADVSSHTWGGGQANYRVRVDIREFETTPGDSVRLDAVWLVQGGGTVGEARAGHFVGRVPAGGAGYDQLVAAHGTALARMSKDIAEAIRSMAAPSR